MYGPDSYLYETNFALLGTLSDEELADPALLAQLTPSVSTVAALGQALAAAIWEGLVALGAALAPAVAYSVETDEAGAASWHYLPFC